jgi:hypothetical protein
VTPSWEVLVFDPEFVKWIATLGVGGILAGFMFAFYRKDVKQYTELWRITAEQMMNIIKDNTASNSKLIMLIESQERNQLRRTDIALIRQHLQFEEDRQEQQDKQRSDRLGGM